MRHDDVSRTGSFGVQMKEGLEESEYTEEESEFVLSLRASRSNTRGQSGLLGQVDVPDTCRKVVPGPVHPSFLKGRSDPRDPSVYDGTRVVTRVRGPDTRESWTRSSGESPLDPLTL